MFLYLSPQLLHLANFSKEQTMLELCLKMSLKTILKIPLNLAWKRQLKTEGLCRPDQGSNPWSLDYEKNISHSWDACSSHSGIWCPLPPPPHLFSPSWWKCLSLGFCCFCCMKQCFRVGVSLVKSLALFLPNYSKVQALESLIKTGLVNTSYAQLCVAKSGLPLLSLCLILLFLFCSLQLFI